MTNFREKFEAWHKRRFGYVTAPKKGFTAFNCEYPEGKQQARWEGWQAQSGDAYQAGHNAGVAHHKQALQLDTELETRK